MGSGTRRIGRERHSAPLLHRYPSWLDQERLGWVYGWKLHLAVTVGAVWIPLAVRLTPANASDNMVAPLLIEALPEEVRFALGDTHHNAENVCEACAEGGSW